MKPTRLPNTIAPADWTDEEYRGGIQHVRPRITEEELQCVDLVTWMLWSSRKVLGLEPWLYGVEKFPPDDVRIKLAKTTLNYKVMRDFMEYRHYPWRDPANYYHEFHLLRPVPGPVSDFIEVKVHPTLIVEMRRRYFLREDYDE